MYPSISDRLPKITTTITAYVIFADIWCTYLESHDRRHVLDKARDTENHVGRVAVLLNSTVYL